MKKFLLTIALSLAFISLKAQTVRPYVGEDYEFIKNDIKSVIDEAQLKCGVSFLDKSIESDCSYPDFNGNLVNYLDFDEYYSNGKTSLVCNKQTVLYPIEMHEFTMSAFEKMNFFEDVMGYEPGKNIYLSLLNPDTKTYVRAEITSFNKDIKMCVFTRVKLIAAN